VVSAKLNADVRCFCNSRLRAKRRTEGGNPGTRATTIAIVKHCCCVQCIACASFALSECRRLRKPAGNSKVEYNVPRTRDPVRAIVTVIVELYRLFGYEFLRYGTNSKRRITSFFGDNFTLTFEANDQRLQDSRHSTLFVQI
jgi:hypothetical protein